MSERDEEIRAMRNKIQKLRTNIKKKDDKKVKVHRLGASDYRYDGKRDGFIRFTQHLAASVVDVESLHLMVFDKASSTWKKRTIEATQLHEVELGLMSTASQAKTRALRAKIGARISEIMTPDSIGDNIMRVYLGTQKSNYEEHVWNATNSSRYLKNRTYEIPPLSDINGMVEAITRSIYGDKNQRYARERQTLKQMSQIFSQGVFEPVQAFAACVQSQAQHVGAPAVLGRRSGAEPEDGSPMALLLQGGLELESPLESFEVVRVGPFAPPLGRHAHDRRRVLHGAALPCELRAAREHAHGVAGRKDDPRFVCVLVLVLQDLLQDQRLGGRRVRNCEQISMPVWS